MSKIPKVTIDTNKPLIVMDFPNEKIQLTVSSKNLYKLLQSSKGKSIPL